MPLVNSTCNNPTTTSLPTTGEKVSSHTVASVGGGSSDIAVPSHHSVVANNKKATSVAAPAIRNGNHLQRRKSLTKSLVKPVGGAIKSKQGKVVSSSHGVSPVASVRGAETESCGYIVNSSDNDLAVSDKHQSSKARELEQYQGMGNGSTS